MAILDGKRDKKGDIGYGPVHMEVIEHIDGVDTVALQGSSPELFNVTAKPDGMTRWTLRPEVRAVLRRLNRAVQ